MNTSTLVAALLGIVILFAAVSCEVSLWNECRRDHSVLYCLRTLDH